MERNKVCKHQFEPENITSKQIQKSCSNDNSISGRVEDEIVAETEAAIKMC